MALKSPITSEHQLFTGTDKGLEFSIFQKDTVTPQNITGWSLSWVLKRSLSDTDAAAKITKTTASGIVITGTYSTNPAVNTQVARVTLSDDETLVLAARLYQHELKRMDAGFEEVLAFGSVFLKQGAHRS